MKRIFVFASLLIVQCYFAQTFSPADFLNCMRNNCDHYAMVKNRGFRVKYSGPRKESGIISLYHNPKAREYIFIYTSNENEIEQINYYLPTKLLYQNFLNKKTEKVSVSGVGKVRYDDGKTYYHAIISKRKNFN